jgi:DNA-binding CsgD family transcriptional regulator
MDPATLLPTGHMVENALPDATMPRYTEIEIREPDFNKFTALTRAPQPAASLSAATAGTLDRSVRHRELRPAELAPLIAEAYGLTRRERVVTQLVAQGLATDAIGRRLHLSPYTVQDHLKSIFEKVGVGTRGELVARLFFDHYAPRLTLS